jgi:hypothetical protein
MDVCAGDLLSTRVMPVPTVNCDALLALKALLRTLQHPDIGHCGTTPSIVRCSSHEVLMSGS